MKAGCWSGRPAWPLGFRPPELEDPIAQSKRLEVNPSRLPDASFGFPSQSIFQPQRVIDPGRFPAREIDSIPPDGKETRDVVLRGKDTKVHRVALTQKAPADRQQRCRLGESLAHQRFGGTLQLVSIEAC